MKKQRVDAICFAGDVTDGGTKMHPGFEYETFSHGADAQEEEAADILIPEAERLRVPWYVIGGNHDNSHYKQGGIDIVERLCRRSDWFNYLSPGLGNARNSVGFIRIGRLLVEICHPHMGSAYAWSYRGQKWIEALSPENKPHLVLMGNFHKPLQMDYRNIHYLMLPAYQSQSSWMASKSLVSTVGSAILEVGTEPMGLSPSIKLEWLIERVPREKDWG
jgi:Icc-related predicted phosphoesterase